MEAEKHVEYEKPAVIDYGDLLELTAGTHNGTQLDATFPVHTKKSQLTFSVIGARRSIEPRQEARLRLEHKFAVD